MTATVQISNVTKYYSRTKTAAVHGLSLALEPGEVYGLLGANGAGKTTTLRMTLDFIRPSSGTIRLFGEDNRRNGAQLRSRVGYLPGDVVLPKGATGHDFLAYLGGVDHEIDHAYLQQLAKRFEAQLGKRMNELSKGNRQKIGLIQACMHRPDILVLDEPTSGLDPLMQEAFYHTIAEARKRGATVLLSSHSFEEVQRVCDRIGIMRKGKLVYEGLATDVIATQKPRWQITFRHAEDAEKLQTNSALHVIAVGHGSLTAEPAGSIEKALAALSHYAIVSMTTSQHALEDEFLRFYEEEV